MSHDDHAVCPDPDTLAAFAEGKLKRHEMPLILAHLADCMRCTAAVEAVNEDLFGEKQQPVATIGRHWWLLAAAIVVAILAVPLTRQLLTRQSSVSRLVALAPKSARVVEPRLSGGFAWAAYAGADRAAGEKTDTRQMQLGGAAGELAEQADRDRGVDAQHAAGVAMVLVEKPADAIPRLEAAAANSRDAQIWSDLAAARYATASQLGRASLYPTALAAADTALRSDPRLPEALFNRALILERLGLMEEAKQAWQRYLEVDPSSQWATEARARLADLPVSTRRSQFDRDRPLLEEAAARGDASAVHKYVEAHRDRARAYAEGEYLGRWGDAVQRNDAGEAMRWLSIARTIGNALGEISGESLARDAVHAIDGASPAGQKTIAAAHVLYRSARIAYSRGERDAAERDLLRAAEAFESQHDPMALMARYYAAGARLARSDTTGAHDDLERARVLADLHPTYLSLGAHVRWELGRTLAMTNDWSGVVSVLSDGAALFRRSGEHASEAFVEMLLAQALSFLGREDDAWLARARAFAALSAEGESSLLATSVSGATKTELAGGRREAALALSALALSIARAGSQPQLVIEALVNRARLESMSGHPADALQSARQAEEIAKGTADAALRARNLAIVAVAIGGALVETDPRAAAEPLTRAIDFYEQHNLPFPLIEPLLLRSRCAVRTGDPVAAMRDLERGMAIVESHPPTPGIFFSEDVLDAEHALFEDAIRLSLGRNETAAAFAFAERSHGGAVTLPELQRRLDGSGVVVLEIVALPEELITFAVAENDVVVARRTRSSDSLALLADESLSESGTTAAATLYDDVIRPVDAVLVHAREVVIVPDRHLVSAPFAALYDSSLRRHLIERFAMSIASSAGSLSWENEHAGALSLVTIALPTGDAESVALPEVEREAREVAAIYTHAESIPPVRATLAALRSAAAGADVVHIAGHTERQPGGGEQALLFAGTTGRLERVSWKTIVAQPPPHAGLIVLAACETLRAPASAATHSLSLGGAFSAAGAAGVVGTLAPIGDHDARLLFGALHRYLVSGARPAEALRAAQLEAIARDKTNDGRRAWGAVALLTRRIPAPSSRKGSLSWAN